MWVRVCTRLAWLTQLIGLMWLCYSGYVQYDNLKKPLEQANILGVWLGLILGCVFFVISLVLVAAIRHRIPKAEVRKLLPVPTFFVCLFAGIYFYAFG